MFEYTTQGTCSKKITFEVDGENKLRNVQFTYGCHGNLQGIAKLVEGRTLDEVEPLLSGIRCGMKSTSCPDQLARAIRAYKATL